MKRLVDLLIVVPSLILLSPLLAAVALCIKLASPGPVLFRQDRVGRHGRIFRIFKFRTMTITAPPGGPLVTAADDPRVTRLGRWLRRTKIDELPQLLNVVLGDMSLVGPRPQVPRFVRHYPEGVRETILSVRPGLTDPATLFYRNEEQLLAETEDPERVYLERILPHKLEMYVEYIERQTLGSDWAILLQTLGCLLRPAAGLPGTPGTGVNRRKSGTAPSCVRPSASLSLHPAAATASWPPVGPSQVRRDELPCAVG